MALQSSYCTPTVKRGIRGNTPARVAPQRCRSRRGEITRKPDNRENCHKEAQEVPFANGSRQAPIGAPPAGSEGAQASCLLSASDVARRVTDCVRTSAERRRRVIISSLGQCPRINWMGCDRTEGPIHRSGFQPFPTPPDTPGPMAQAGNETGRWPLMLGHIVEPKFSHSLVSAGAPPPRRAFRQSSSFSRLSQTLRFPCLCGGDILVLLVAPASLPIVLVLVIFLVLSDRSARRPQDPRPWIPDPTPYRPADLH
jgi:hypothetical protein